MNILIIILMCCCLSSGYTKKNILFFVIDDFRPNIAAYGSKFMHTPHLDALAAQGMLFQKAYVQYSLCGPSRNSFMTGRRPDATKVWSFMNHFREIGIGENWTTLPQYFKKHGYIVFGTGKIFHRGLPPNFDVPFSWHEFNFPGKCKGTHHGWPKLESNIKNVVCRKTVDDCDHNKSGSIVAKGEHWCAVDTSKRNIPLTDDLIARAAIDYLERAANGNKPFFIGVGFHKPHLPFQYPKEFGDLYPKKVASPKHNVPPKGMPLTAWHRNKAFSEWNVPSKDISELRRAYYSAVSYTDSKIGKVLAKLDSLNKADQTVVVVSSDHGWQLGEMNAWRKQSNFELAVRIPLIFRVPWKPKSNGIKCGALVEAVDLYPTMVALAGLPRVPSKEALQGLDLSPLFDDPTKQLKSYAFSQMAKRFVHSKKFNKDVSWGGCEHCKRNEIDVQGYSVRSDIWRYTEWVSWNKSSYRPIWDIIVGRELYKHRGDDGSDFDRATPTSNVWDKSPKHRNISAELSKVIHKQFNNDYIPPN